MDLLSMSFALFLLMDSIGNVPIFVSILKDIDSKRQTKIIFRELIIALLILLAFNFAGNTLLKFLNIQMPTILVAGGIILFLIAIKMIFPSAAAATKQETKPEHLLDKEPFIVPLATPLVAGPAVLAAVMLYAGQANKYVTLVAIVIAWAASTVVLLSSPVWKRVLGNRGLTACERFMGLILTLLAVQMFLSGIEMFMQNCHALKNV